MTETDLEKTAMQAVEAIAKVLADAKGKPLPAEGTIKCPSCTADFRYRVRGPRAMAGRCTRCELQFIA